MRIESSRASLGANVQLRGALLMPICALAVHQLRYYAAFGPRAGTRLSHDGHAYLSQLIPVLVLVSAIVLGGFVGRFARARQRPARADARRHAIARTWVICATALFALYCGQELIEGITASGHAGGVAGIIGHGGWIAAPLSCLVAAALTGALRIADALMRIAATRQPVPARATSAHRPPDRAPRSDWRLEPQSGVVAGRAPPAGLSLA